MASSEQTNPPPTDIVRDLIARQALQIAVLRAQAEAFKSLADFIAREGVLSSPDPQDSPFLSEHDGTTSADDLAA